MPPFVWSACLGALLDLVRQPLVLALVIGTALAVSYALVRRADRAREASRARVQAAYLQAQRDLRGRRVS